MREEIIIIKDKKEILEKYKSGIPVNDLSNVYSMLKSTIMTILQRKILYKQASVAKGVTQINKLPSTV